MDNPEVILHKKIKTDTPDGRVMSSKLRRGAINWEPPYPEGEDEASMRKHKEALETEWRRRNPDKKRIEQGMLLTFPERRRQMNQQMPITEVKAKYPSLFDFTQVKHVFIIMRWLIFSSLFSGQCYILHNSNIRGPLI